MDIKIAKDFDIKPYTTFKIGGKMKMVCFPKNLNEMLAILREKPNIIVLGNLSNTLVSTSGYDEAVIVTSKMDEIKFEGTKVVAMCGVKGPKLAQEVCKAGLSGLEFMIGFPGSVGGEVYMNASANKQAISDHIVSVTCYHRTKGLVKYTKDEMDFNYRSSRCQRDDLVVLFAEFDLKEKNPQEIQKQMDENLAFRKSHQPSLALPNCGSIFKNPPTDSAGRLLESVGAKEINIGKVRVWRNHANFIVNTDNGTSLDVLTLMLELKERVRAAYNIDLEPEIKFLGNKNKKEEEIWLRLNKK